MSEKIEAVSRHAAQVQISCFMRFGFRRRSHFLAIILHINDFLRVPQHQSVRQKAPDANY